MKKSWFIWGCAALFFAYQFAIRVSPSVMTNELMGVFHTDACDLGFLVSFYMYAYALLQVPVGNILDKIGPRKLLLGCALICAGSSFLFASAEHVLVASVARFLMGMGSAGGFLSCVKLATTWFPPERLPFVVGLTVFVGTIGAMSGSVPTAYLVDFLGWREALMILGGVGLLICLLIYVAVHDHAPDKFKNIEPHVPASLISNLSQILINPQTWVLAAFGFLIYTPVAGFADVWGVPFLTSSHDINKQTAALSTTLFYLGMGMGSFLFGHFFSLRKKLGLMCSASGALVCFSSIVYWSDLPDAIVLVLFVLTGMFVGGQYLVYSVVCDIHPLNLSGTATGFQNMMGVGCGIVIQPLVGWVLRFLWTGYTENGIPTYGTYEFQVALSTIVIALVMALFLVGFMNVPKQPHAERTSTD